MAVETLLIAWGYVLSGVFSVIIIYFLSEGFPETSSFEWSVCFVLGPFILALFFGILGFCSTATVNKPLITGFMSILFMFRKV